MKLIYEGEIIKLRNIECKQVVVVYKNYEFELAESRFNVQQFEKKRGGIIELMRRISNHEDLKIKDGIEIQMLMDINNMKEQKVNDCNKKLLFDSDKSIMNNESTGKNINTNNNINTIVNQSILNDKNLKGKPEVMHNKNKDGKKNLNKKYTDNIKNKEDSIEKDKKLLINDIGNTIAYNINKEDEFMFVCYYENSQSDNFILTTIEMREQRYHEKVFGRILSFKDNYRIKSPIEKIIENRNGKFHSIKIYFERNFKFENIRLYVNNTKSEVISQQIEYKSMHSVFYIEDKNHNLGFTLAKNNFCYVFYSRIQEN